MNGQDVKAPLGILLLEDSPTDARLLMESLREAITAGQVMVQTVRRLADALRELKRFSFSCVLVDLGLPDGEGVAHVQRIREADRGVAIVVLTGLEDERAARQAFELGAQAYLVKGRYWGEELLHVVRRAVALSGRTEAEPAGTAAPAMSAGPRFQPWVDITRNRWCGLHAEVPGVAADGAAIQLIFGAWAALRSAGLEPGSLSLALGATAEAESGILDRLPAWLEAAGLRGSELRLRVSVDTLLRRSADPALIERLRGEGVGIVVDSWGLDAAPLHVLTRLPLDALVFDASLTRALVEPEGEAAQRFVRATLAAGASLGMEVLAEGVAVAEQHSRLATLGCRVLRGDWYCLPETVAELPLRWSKGPRGLERRG